MHTTLTEMHASGLYAYASEVRMIRAFLPCSLAPSVAVEKLWGPIATE